MIIVNKICNNFKLQTLRDNFVSQRNISYENRLNLIMNIYEIRAINTVFLRINASTENFYGGILNLILLQSKNFNDFQSAVMH